MTGAGASQHRPPSIGIKLPGLDSNQDKESQNPNTPKSKSKTLLDLSHSSAGGRSAGRSSEQGEGGVTDANLAALVAAWPMLPEPIKAAIRALVGTVTGPS